MHTDCNRRSGAPDIKLTSNKNYEVYSRRKRIRLRKIIIILAMNEYECSECVCEYKIFVQYNSVRSAIDL